MTNPTYYDGDLAADLMAAALQVIERDGPSAVSMRSLARGLGVSHAAPKTHFRDKAALFAAVAIEGFTGLGDALGQAHQTPSDAPLIEGGVAYVAYALTHPGHFAVMWRPDLYPDNDAVSAAKSHARDALVGLVDGQEADASTTDSANRAWAFAHGWASLLSSGAFKPPTADPLDYVREQMTRAAEAAIAGTNRRPGAEGQGR